MSTTYPFFSIIIPTYNRANCIGNAIQSVIDQTFTNWELIIIDDGSIDNTKSVIESFNDERIRYYWQENKQLNGARNSGIQISKGLYLTFLDDDDLYTENHLLIHFNFIKENNNPVAIIHSGMISKYKNESYLSKEYSFENYKHPVLYQWKIGMNLLPLTIHKKIFNEFMFDERFLLWDDAHFLIRVLFVYPLYQIENAFTTIYNISPQSRSLTYISKEKVENSIDCLLDIYNKNKDELKKIGITKKNINDEISKIYIHNAHNSLQINSYNLGFNYFFKAIKYKTSTERIGRILIFIPKSMVLFISHFFRNNSSEKIL